MKSISLFITLAVALVVLNGCSKDDKDKKPDSTSTKEQTNELKTQKVKMSIDGMVCNACQSSVKKTIKSVYGVKDVEVSLENRNAIVTYYPNIIKADSIQKAVNKGGFTAGKPQEIKQ